MAYKANDRVKHEDMNWLLEAAGSPPDPEAVQEQGQRVGRFAPRGLSGLMISPVQALGAYEVMQGSSFIRFDTDKRVPVLQVSNAQATTVADGSNLFYATSGKLPLTAGSEGWGEVIEEGKWYWIATDVSGLKGYCGLKQGESKLRAHYPGFLSCGTITIDGVTCAYVTKCSNQSLKMRTKVGFAIGAGSFAKAWFYAQTSSGWSITTEDANVWNAVGAGLVAADKDILVDMVQGRLVVNVEACTT